VFAWHYPSIRALVTAPFTGYEEAARQVVESAVSEASQWAPEVQFSASDRVDPTVPALLDACTGAELLVLGSRGHGGFLDALLGSVAHQCAHHAPCSVVVVRPHLDEGDAASGGSAP
jgi:nucleotide-binding universal stress UspA family protein